MLNVAVIRSVAYYLDQVAHSRADYYLGRGESPGRWAGSLASSFGLAGTVAPDTLRAVLEGHEPASGEPFVGGRPARVCGRRPPGRAPATMGVDAAADALGVSARTVRRWAAAGEAAWRATQDATPDRPLRTAAEVHDRLRQLGVTDGEAEGPTCLLVPPASGRRRRFDVPAEEVARLRESRRAPAARQRYDVVFRPAKGWSVLWAVGPPQLRRDLRDIHQDAVADALAYLEDTAARGRATVAWRGRRVRVRARGDGFLAACFDHRESRAGDPLLHTHCLIANVTRLPDGRLGALEASGLFRQQRAADAVYRATFLRLASQRLGIRPAAGPEPFPEPEGVPAEVIADFSKRSDEIAEEVARHGSASAAARQLAALATRRAKEVAARDDDLHSRWRQEAATLGFGAAEVTRCLDRARVAAPTDAELADLGRRLAAPDGLSALSATFNRGDVVQVMADALPGAMSGPDIVAAADAFLASNTVLQVREHRPGRPRGRVLEPQGVVDDLALSRFSVPELAATEARLISAARHRSGPTVDEQPLEAALRRFPHLSAEQADMVRSVCRSPLLLRPVVGLPGSGKTTAAGALVAALQASRVPVVGAAVTATAAAELQQRTGVLSCDTLARLLMDIDTPGGDLSPGTVVLVDEASMLPTRSLDRLVTHVESAGGAVVLVGDPHQHPAVGPGSFFAWLVTQTDDIPTLTGNLRQSPDLTAVESHAARALRAGDVAASLQLREEAGLLTRAATPADLRKALVADRHQDWPATRDPMLAASNDTRERLNTAARQLLETEGSLTGPVRTTTSGREFRAGDWVVARHNDRRLRDPADPRFWVRNGASGQIVAVNASGGDVTVEFTAGRVAEHRVRLPAAYVDAHLEHGYARTDYGVQGRTLTRSRAVLEEASTTPGAYVATTRGRVENHVYVTDGDLIDEDGLDTSHGIPRLRGLGLDALAKRIAARRPDGMLHDRSPDLIDAAALSEHANEGQLREELRRIEAQIEDIGSDPCRALRSARAAHENIAGQQRPAGELRKHDDDLRRLQRSIDRLKTQARNRKRALEQQPARLRRRATIADAIATRDTKQRLAAKGRSGRTLD